MFPKVQTWSQETDSLRGAGLCLVQVYTALAERGTHLLGDLLQGQSPKQWTHYPEDDARDPSGYQWFYHSHSPEDRPGAMEHGHIHLFARRQLWGRRLRSRAEQSFTQLCGGPSKNPLTRHLLTIGFDAKGLPISLFTVNSWVTGDLMLNAALTLDLLEQMRLNTGHAEIDSVIESIVQLYLREIEALLAQRDVALAAHRARDKLEDQTLELLSQLPLDLDAKWNAVCAR